MGSSFDGIVAFARIVDSGSFRSNSAEMLRAVALEGIGIAVLPTWAVFEPLRMGALRCVVGIRPKRGRINVGDAVTGSRRASAGQ